MQRSTWTQKALVVTLGVAVLASSVAIMQRSNDYAFFDPLIDIKSQISRYYVEDIDDRELQIGAINGMLDVLGDPYTVYVPERQSDEFNKDLTGEYVGIGAEVIVRDGQLTIVTPLDDSPAFNAGVMADDRIIAIDGEETDAIDVQQAVGKLTGEPGTPVELTIERDGEVVEVRVIRDRIKTRAVKGLQRETNDEQRWSYLIDGERRIAYVRLTRFTPGCADEILNALINSGAGRDAADEPLGGLILDVRWNPGGLLDEAAAIADFFLNSGTIVSTRGRAYDETVAEASAPGTLADFPIAVLVNGQSASASEVLAGALQENNRAIIIGTRTFGKGSVQAVKSLESRGGAGGGVLKITEQRYYLPSGRSLQRLDHSVAWGVDPDPGFFVPIEDEQLNDLFRVRRESEIIRNRESADESRWSDPDWIEQNQHDPQLAAAVRAVQKRVDSGAWVAVGEQGNVQDPVTQAELEHALRARERILRELARVDRRLDAISAVGDIDDAAQNIELWPDDAEIVGGFVVVTDAAGEEVARLKITGENLERWLMDADVTPAERE